MQGLLANKEEAQKIKSYLISNGFYDKSRPVIKAGDKLILPLIRMPDMKKDCLLKRFSSTKLAEYPSRTKKKISNNYKDLLRNVLTLTELNLLPTSFDIIGDILILDLKTEIVKHQKFIGKAILAVHKNIRTVLKKKGEHQGEFRTQKLTFVAGIRKKETIYKENSVSIMLDVEKVYFSPRLSTERKRIMMQVVPSEDILVMFSGCGPYLCVIAKNSKAKQILGIEKNKIAHEYAIKNIAINRLSNISLLNADVRDAVPLLQKRFDRIVMPLPKDANSFLDIAIPAAKKGAIIHLYDFVHENDIGEGEIKVKRACDMAKRKCRILNTIKCGQYSPGKFRICVDFKVL